VSATELVSRALVRLLPRSFRDDLGEDVVRLACDRRRFGGEPVWRLWPSLVGDTASSAVRLRREEAMFPTRAALAGFGLAFGVFAILSGGLLIGLPLLLAVGLVVHRTQPSLATGRRAPRWVPWCVVGVALVAASFAVMGASEDELTAVEWFAILGLMMVGLWGLGTALVIALDARRTGRSTPAPA
jgi:hypothetical protein